jgi:hypothetical protein
LWRILCDRLLSRVGRGQLHCSGRLFGGIRRLGLGLGSLRLTTRRCGLCSGRFGCCCCWGCTGSSSRGFGCKLLARRILLLPISSACECSVQRLTVNEGTECRRSFWCGLVGARGRRLRRAFLRRHGRACLLQAIFCSRIKQLDFWWGACG